MEEQIRLNKLLSDYGVCSRRQADRLIEQGKVFVDDEPAQMGMKVKASQKIEVDGETVVTTKRKNILIAFNKPRGIVCTTSKEDKDNIIDYINYPERIYPIGRLDKDSEGLILLTNNGELMDSILRSRNGHEKEYLVGINKPLTPSIKQALEQGVPILDTMTKPCKIHTINDKEFTITITQGLNRQIRRMCDYFGLRVNYLKRVRIINIQLGDLATGKYRNVTMEEYRELMNQTKGMKFYNESKESNGRIN